MKPYYDDGQCVIYHGDCREIIPRLGNIDALLTDPPYGIGFYRYASHDDNVDAYPDLLTPAITSSEALIQNGWCAVYQAAARASEWATLIPRAWRLIALPKTFSQMKPGQWPFCSTDYVLLWRVGEPIWPGKGERIRDWAIQQTSNMAKRERGHPCSRPLAGVLHVLRAVAPPGGLVLDPFMGSGTTLRAAKDLGRKAIGIEIEERYCEIAARRLSQEVLPFMEKPQP